MRLKADWQKWLHAIRKRELDIVFSQCPKDTFKHALELGAGTGFQSSLLIHWASRLICTDFNFMRLEKTDNESINYVICDAQEIGYTFKDNQFDLIFSSNLLEHLPDSPKSLLGIHRVLKDNGIAVHVVPNLFWKLCHLLFYFPNKFVTYFEKMIEPGGLGTTIKRVLGSHADETKAAHGLAYDNNPQRHAIQRSLISRLALPKPHGASLNNLQEFKVFRKSRWKKEFTAANFRVVKTLKGPVSSGYGFGFDRIRKFLEMVGVSSETIFIVAKEDEKLSVIRWFQP